MVKADLRELDLINTDFTGCDLGGADLRDADCSGAVFTDAEMAGARLEGAILYDAKLAGARHLEPSQLRGADIRLATLPEWSAADGAQYPDLGIGIGTPAAATAATAADELRPGPWGRLTALLGRRRWRGA